MNEQRGGQMSLHRENLIWDIRSSDQECQRFSSRVTGVRLMHKEERINDSIRRRRNRLHRKRVTMHRSTIVTYIREQMEVSTTRLETRTNHLE
jgi:hypothetical protein